MEKKPLTKHPETRGKIISECDNSVTRPFLQSKEIFQKIKLMAERVGFEPTVPLTVHKLSKPAP